jgi:hypothetical protein
VCNGSPEPISPGVTMFDTPVLSGDHRNGSLTEGHARQPLQTGLRLTAAKPDKSQPTVSFQTFSAPTGEEVAASVRTTRHGGRIHRS